jgi:hypothetical protein
MTKKLYHARKEAITGHTMALKPARGSHQAISWKLSLHAIDSVSKLVAILGRINDGFEMIDYGLYGKTTF